ncbi:hypothetical protein V8C35DRAFT_311919 [Trichoderma chlorosporum]
MGVDVAGFQGVSDFLIPNYFFTAPDASTHIFEFLSSPNIRGQFHGSIYSTPEGDISNWTDACKWQGNPFVGYGYFLGCLLYSNITRGVEEKTLPANLTDIGFSASKEYQNYLSKKLLSDYPTCLVAYCASQSDCASSDICDVGNLLTDSYQLSAQGVANCYQFLCSIDVQGVNADIAGIGVLLSYLIQSIIALVGTCALAILNFIIQWHKYKGASLEIRDSESEQFKFEHHARILNRAKKHAAIINSTLAEFHKAQCYFAIALQIASLVLIVSDFASTTFIDQNFLFLVSLDGLIPVVLTLYTLMMFGKKSWYIITISLISVVLSSATGGYLIQNVFSSEKGAAQGGAWPTACGYIGPTSICSDIGPNNAGSDFNTDGTFVLAIIIILDILVISLILWKVLTDLTSVLSTANKCLARYLAGSEQQMDLIQRVTKIFCHSLATLTILTCLIIEFYYFSAIFYHSPYVDFKSWGFGQIVGLTTWFGTFIEVVYLEYRGLADGLEWRWPKWLHTFEIGKKTPETPDKSPEPAVPLPKMMRDTTRESGPRLFSKNTPLLNSAVTPIDEKQGDVIVQLTQNNHSAIEAKTTASLAKTSH